MTEHRSLAMVHAASREARDRYRWMLLTGWFVLIATVFPFVVAMPHRVQPASEVLAAIAALAFLVYSLAIKRYWVVGLALMIAFIAVVGWILVR